MSTINYNPAPTIKAFIKHHRKGELFADWAIGAVGSGKTTGNFFKLIYLASLQAPSPRDGVRRSRAVIVRNCYDDETEILTEQRGWRLFKDLVREDRVAMRSDTGEMVFVTPSMHYKAEYTGEMVCVEQENMSLCVTPDHNLFTATTNGRTKARAGYKLEQAHLAYGKTNREFTSLAGWQGADQTVSERWFEFLGFWFAEGSAGVYDIADRRHWRIVIAQKTHLDYAESLLSHLGLKYGKSDKGDGNYNLSLSTGSPELKWLAARLAQCGKAKTKQVPNWIKAAPRGHLIAFMRGFIMGDGSYRRNAHETTRMWTASKELADDLHEIAVKAGYAATVHYRYREEGSGKSNGTPSELYCVTLLTFVRSTPAPRKDAWSKKHYEGMIYCVEVPTHVVYVRRHGRAVWCGQTAPQLRDTTITSWMYWFKDGEAGTWKATDAKFILRFADVECEVMFRPLDTPDDVARVLSLEVTFAIFDEFVQIDKQIVQAIGARCGRYPPPIEGGATNWGMWGASNPGNEDDWWHDALFGSEEPGGAQFGADHFNWSEEEKEARRNERVLAGLAAESTWTYFEQPSGFSPDAENTENLPGGKGYYTNLARDKDPHWVAQFIEVQWGYSISGKPVIATFKPDIHIAKEVLKFNPGLKLVGGLDPGIGGMAMLNGQENHFGQLLVLSELAVRGYGASRFINDKLKPHLKQSYPNADFEISPDPAAAARAQTDERTVVDVFKKDFVVRLATTNNQLPGRIEAIEHFTTRITENGPALLISPTCKRLIRALRSGWRYEATTKGHLKPQPKKNEYSHVGDAFSYLCQRFFRIDERTAKEAKYAKQPKVVYRNPYHNR